MSFRLYSNLCANLPCSVRLTSSVNNLWNMIDLDMCRLFLCITTHGLLSCAVLYAYV